MGAFSVWHLLILLLVVLLVFGTKKIRNIGEDLGGALKGFKQGMKDGTDTPVETPKVADRNTVDVEARDRTRT